MIKTIYDVNQVITLLVPNTRDYTRPEKFRYFYSLVIGSIYPKKELNLTTRYQLRLYDAKKHTKIWQECGWVYATQIPVMNGRDKNNDSLDVTFYLTQKFLDEKLFYEL